VDEQILSFKDSLRVVLRYRRVAAAVALVGLFLGLAYAVAAPDPISAKALVLLPAAATSSSGIPTYSIATDVEIAMTPAILDPATNAAGISEPYSTIEHQVSVTASTPNVLQIVAKSSSASKAERLANAVATTFIHYSNSQAALFSTTNVAGWTQQVAADQSQITVLKNEISTTSKAMNSAGTQQRQDDSQLIVSYTTELDNITSLMKILNSEINLAHLSGQSPASGAAVAQSATSANQPSALRILKLGVIGLLVGLILGIVAAFAVGRKDRRLRQRDEIARAAGAPVLASLSAVRRHKSEDLLGLLDHFEPSVIDKANLRRLLDELEVERRPAGASGAQNGSSSHRENGSSVHHDSVGVHAIVLAGDDMAVAAATEIPAFAASLGIPVALVVAGSNASTQQLAIACAARDPLDLDAPRPNLLTYASAPGKAPAGVTLAVTLEVVDPLTLDVSDIQPAAVPPGRRQVALLVVTAGYAKPEDLEVVALAAEHHGSPLVGVVVTDPEPSDQTSGLQQPRRSMSPNGPRQLAALRSTSR
jgi:capsular polysaccharide biosynthesis protein